MRKWPSLYVVAVLASFLIAQEGLAQQPVITSFQGNGQLTWTNAPGTNTFRVEWAGTLAGTNIWKRNWWDLDYIPSTGTATTVTVPMFYRVAQETNVYDNTTLSNAWMLTASFLSIGTSGTYVLFDGHGLVIDSAGSSHGYPGAPLGFYGVSEDGFFSSIDANTVESSRTPLSGQMISPREGVVRHPLSLSGQSLLKVMDPGLCQGVWTGTVYQTSPSPMTNSISFDIDANGAVANFVGFTGPVYGDMFALSASNGMSSAGFHTGEADPVNWINLTGSLSTDTFTGQYEGGGAYGSAGNAILNRQ